MRLYFLKSSDEQVNQLKIERALLKEMSQGIASREEAQAYFNLHGLEMADCVLSIFLFELFRLFRSGRTLYSKDQLQFKILYFFSRLKLAKPIDTEKGGACLYNTQGDPELYRRRKSGHASLDEDSESDDESQELCELID